MKRNWNDENGNVIISDGQERCDARFSTLASDERIIREYLDSYGYCDPEEIHGWIEGTLVRDITADEPRQAPVGRTVYFWWKLIDPLEKLRDGGYRYHLRLTMPVGESRADGYRY